MGLSDRVKFFHQAMSSFRTSLPYLATLDSRWVFISQNCIIAVSVSVSYLYHPCMAAGLTECCSHYA